MEQAVVKVCIAKVDVVRFGGVESESNYTRYRVCHDDDDC